MRPLVTLAALAAAIAPALALGVPAAYALDPDAFAVGLSSGYTSLYQYTTSVQLRAHPLGAHSELVVGFDNRTQGLSADSTYAIESTGLALGLGTRWAMLRAGVSGEVSALKRLQTVDASSNRLAYRYAPGLLLEPYLAWVLPVLDTPFSEADLSLRWPVYASDAALGPSLMATIWLGGRPPRHKAADDDEPGPAPSEPNGPTSPERKGPVSAPGLAP